MNDTTEKIIKLLKRLPNGATGDLLNVQLNGISKDEQAASINYLLKSGQLSLFKELGNLVYKYKEPLREEVKVKLQRNEDRMIYNEIEKSGNKGISAIEIRKKLNLKAIFLNKILKELEKSNVIKCIKCVTTNKKMYISANIEADSSLTGGVFFDNNKFESEFVDMLQKQCLKFLRMKAEKAKEIEISNPGALQRAYDQSCVSVAQAHTFITSLNISRVVLRPAEVESILYACVLDGEAEKCVDNNGNVTFKAVRTGFTEDFFNIPCSSCELFEKCSINPLINPNCCQYINQWLQF